MAAHAIIGSPLWTVRPDPQSSRKEQVAESVETSLGEARFDEHRRAVLGVLDISPEEQTVSGGNGDDHRPVPLFHRWEEHKSELQSLMSNPYGACRMEKKHFINCT